jgi:hypothetical protein
LSWFLDRQIVCLAEEASDDAALAAAGDRASYAEVLLHFLERAVEPVRWEGVAMARYGRADDRIHRILDGTRISRGVTRLGWLAILTLAVPMVYLAAAGRPAALAARPTAASSAYLPAVAWSSTAERATTAPVAETASEPAGTASEPAAPDTPAAHSASPPSQPEQGGPIHRYMIVSGDSSSGSWDSRDHLPMDEWRSRFGPDFVWFRQDGLDYIVTDERVLDDLHVAMAPQREVNRMQAEVNRQQREVNRMQAAVNTLQGEVNRQQSEVNRQQREVNDRQRDGYTDHAGQSRVNAMQNDVNDQQHVVNREQGKVNEQQGLVNEEQRKVNAEQRRVSPGIEMAIQNILAATLSNGVAREIHIR